jgi:hypothetical protein
MPKSSLRGDAVWSAFLPFAWASLANFEHAHNYLRRRPVRARESRPLSRFGRISSAMRRCAGGEDQLRP